MRKKLTAVLTTLIILIVIYGIFFTYLSLSTKPTPIAVDGVLDLTAWRFSDEDVIPLDGKWEFYPDKLLYYDNTLHSPYEQEHAERITVPGSWASQMPALGKASYRLQINVNDDTSVYGLKTSSIQISNRILVNGKEIGASGHAANKGSDYALNKPYVSYFNLQMGWNEIVVEVANYHFSASSGINESIYFGHAKQI